MQPLHGGLPFAAQRTALAPLAAGRKLVLATAIAETSLTIPDVRVVVDAGRARRARFDPGSGMTRLVTERVTRAEAEQRRGRAGRVASGWCFRLWTRGEEGGLGGFPPPEIASADLTALALELARLGRGLAGRPRLPDAAAGAGLRRGAGALGRSRGARWRRAGHRARPGAGAAAGAPAARPYAADRGRRGVRAAGGRPGGARRGPRSAARPRRRPLQPARRAARRRPGAGGDPDRGEAATGARTGGDRRRAVGRRRPVARLSGPHRAAPTGDGAALSPVRRKGRGAPRRRPPRRRALYSRR